VRLRTVIDPCSEAAFRNTMPTTDFQIRIGTLYEGTSNMQLQTIAKNLLR